MGWLEGLLTGYVDRHHEIEKQKMDEAIAANQREAKIYEALLNSPNAEVRQMAGVGMLDMANPLRKSKGLKGFMGEVDRSPMMPIIRKYLQTEQPYEHEISPAIPGHTERQQATIPILSTEQARTQLPGHQDVPPPPPSSASLPSTSPTEPGTPAMTPPPAPPPQGAIRLMTPPPGYENPDPGMTVTPPPPDPNQPRGAVRLVGEPPPPPQPQQVDEEALATGPPAPVFNPQTGVLEGGQTFKSETIGARPPSPPWAPESFPVDRNIPGTPAQTETRYRLPQAFPTTEDIQAGTYLGRGRGEYESAVQMFRRAGDPNPEHKAAEFIMAKEMRAGGVPRQGTEYERMLRTYAQRTYNRAVEELTDQEFEHVQQLARTDLEQRSFARTTGTGAAQVNTELNKPIGVVAARELNLPATTRLKDLDQYTLLDQAQKQRLYQVGQVEEEVRVIDELLPKVFPNVEPGMWGKLETAFSLGGKWITGNADIATLDAAIKLAMSNITRIAGETGNLAASDVARAEAALASLTPAVFGGDTLLTARARVAVVHDLLRKAKTVSPGFVPSTTPKTDTTTTTNTTTGGAAETPPPGVKLWTSPSGKVWVNGKLVSR